MKLTTLVIVLALAFVACSKPQNCDVPATSSYLKYDLENCTSLETIVSDTIYTDHETICDCEDFCESLERARQNTLRTYQNILDTTSNKALKIQTEEDYYYLSNITPNCNCK